MNKFILLIVVLATNLVLLVVNVTMKDRLPAEIPSARDRHALLTDFNGDAVTKISLKKGGVAIDLEKQGSVWVMPLQNNRRANSNRVKGLLSDVENAYSKGPRPSTDLNAFQLTDMRRTEVTLLGGGKPTSLYVGKILEPMGAFVQLDAGGAILEIDKSLPTSAGVREEKDTTILDPKYFYDLKIFADSGDDAIEVRMKRGDQVMRIQKYVSGKPLTVNQEVAKNAKPIWFITEPERARANDAKVRNICSTVLNLSGKGYADEIPEKDRGLDNPTAEIEIVLKNGEKRKLTFGSIIDADDVLVGVEGKQDAVKVNRYVYEVCTNLDELKRKEEKKDETIKPEVQVKPFQPIPPSKPDELKPPVIPAPK